GAGGHVRPRVVPGAPGARRGRADRPGREEPGLGQPPAHRARLGAALLGEAARVVVVPHAVLRLRVAEDRQPPAHGDSTVATIASTAIMPSMIPRTTARPFIPDTSSLPFPAAARRS